MTTASCSHGIDTMNERSPIAADAPARPNPMPRTKPMTVAHRAINNPSIVSFRRSWPRRSPSARTSEDSACRSMIDKVSVLATPTTAITADTASIAVPIVVIRSSTLVTEARLSALTCASTLARALAAATSRVTISPTPASNATTVLVVRAGWRRTLPPASRPTVLRATSRLMSFIIGTTISCAPSTIPTTAIRPPATAASNAPPHNAITQYAAANNGQRK